jgi:hypothetical protein
MIRTRMAVMTCAGVPSVGFDVRMPEAGSDLSRRQ